jgi:predicted urease superfamily metal-dependent hydrolase
MKKHKEIKNDVPKLALSREEAAQALGVHPITISRLTANGTLRPSRALRRPLYTVEEIQRFLRDTASKPVNAGIRKLINGSPAKKPIKK